MIEADFLNEVYFYINDNKVVSAHKIEIVGTSTIPHNELRLYSTTISPAGLENIKKNAILHNKDKTIQIKLSGEYEITGSSYCNENNVPFGVLCLTISRLG